MLTPNASAKYIPIQQAESIQLMYDMLKAPEVHATNMIVMN
jgi:hypothetical protein